MKSLDGERGAPYSVSPCSMSRAMGSAVNHGPIAPTRNSALTHAMPIASRRETRARLTRRMISREDPRHTRTPDFVRAGAGAREDSVKLASVGIRACIYGIHVLLTTAHRPGITIVSHPYMPADFLSLLRRDHCDLQQELTRLMDPTATVAELRSALDGVRLGLIAHAEAEDIVLGRFEVIPTLQVLVAQARAAHLAQEGALSALVTSRPGTSGWRDRARHLRELVAYHARQEESFLVPALLEHAPESDLQQLAGAFATERLRQLAMMQPSAPAFEPFTVAEAVSRAY
jgi:hypothetical protein